MNKYALSHYFLLSILLVGVNSFQRVESAAPAVNIDAWNHLQMPNIKDEDLVLEEDMRMPTDVIFVEAFKQDVNVTSDCSIRIHGYKYKPSGIFFQLLNGNNVFIDVTEHSLHFIGGSDHHLFLIVKDVIENGTPGVVQFTVGNGHHLRFRPCPD